MKLNEIIEMLNYKHGQTDDVFKTDIDYHMWIHEYLEWINTLGLSRKQHNYLMKTIKVARQMSNTLSYNSRCGTIFFDIDYSTTNQVIMVYIFGFNGYIVILPDKTEKICYGMEGLISFIFKYFTNIDLWPEE